MTGPKVNPGAVLGAAAVLGAGALTLTSQNSTIAPPPPAYAPIGAQSRTYEMPTTPTKWATWVSRCRKRDGVHAIDAVKVEQDKKKQWWCTWGDGSVELYTPAPVQGDY